MWLVPLVAICITVFLVHGILLASTIVVLLVPVIKDKINSKDNYHSIALASVISKRLKNPP